MFGEHPGHRREHAGLVGDGEDHLVPGADRRHRQHGEIGMGRFGDTGTASDVPPGRRDQVAEHGGCGLDPARTRTVEHEAAGGVCLDEHRVVRAVHGRQRMVQWHEGGVHADADPLDDAIGPIHPLADCEQLDDEAGPGAPARPAPG